MKFQIDRRVRVPKVVRKVIISIFVLLVIIIVAGVAYTYFAADGTNSQSPATAAEKAAAQAPHIYKPAQPAANAPEGVALVSLLSPIKAGTNTSISISTLASSNCSITVTYNKVVSKDSGLVAKVADAYGSVNWTWTVDSSAPAGTWPVKVTCVRNKKSGVLIADLVVVK